MGWMVVGKEMGRGGRGRGGDEVGLRGREEERGICTNRKKELNAHPPILYK